MYKMHLRKTAHILLMIEYSVDERKSKTRLEKKEADFITFRNARKMYTQQNKLVQNKRFNAYTQSLIYIMSSY